MRYVTLWIILLLFSIPLQAELSVQNIEKMVKDIKAKRASKMTSEHKIPSPFITVRQEENSTINVLAPAQPERISFVLGAIVNQSAFINGTWYKTGDKIGDFRLKTIMDDHVVLRRKKRTITLFFKPTKHIVTMSKE